VLGTNGWFTALTAYAQQNSNNTELPDPAEAVVLWLSGLRNNARNPLPDPTASAVDGEPVIFFDFDETRLVDLDGDGLQEYVPKHAPEAPYVYFDGRLMNNTYQYTNAVYPYPTTSPMTSVVGQLRPYRSNLPVNTNKDNGRTKPYTPDNNTQWADAGKFQLICAGLDNHFGAAFEPDASDPQIPIFKQFPAPNYSGKEDSDNIANVTEGKTLEALVP
jgi:hypothetical protein